MLRRNRRTLPPACLLYFPPLGHLLPCMAPQRCEKPLRSSKSSSNASSSQKPSLVCLSSTPQEEIVSPAYDLPRLPDPSVGPHSCHLVYRLCPGLIFPTRTQIHKGRN